MKFTFDQFVHYGRCHTNMTDYVGAGMPLSFTFYGHPVTHENDDRYIINGDVNFHRGGYVVIDDNGDITVFNRS